jgi:hypothetical protein
MFFVPTYKTVAGRHTQAECPRCEYSCRRNAATRSKYKQNYWPSMLHSKKRERGREGGKKLGCERTIYTHTHTISPLLSLSLSRLYHRTVTSSSSASAKRLLPRKKSILLVCIKSNDSLRTSPKRLSRSGSACAS